MKRRCDRETPEFLKGYVPRPAPPALRARVLEAARRSRDRTAFFSPLQWRLVTTCGVIFLIAFLADGLASRRFERHWQALFVEPPAAPIESNVSSAEEAGLKRELNGAFDQWRKRADLLMSAGTKNPQAVRLWKAERTWIERLEESDVDAQSHF